MVTTRRRLRKRWLWLLAPLLLAAGFLLYVSIYYHADETARAALESDGAVTVSRTDYEVLYRGKKLEMPPKELEVLYFLASHPNQVFTREQLLAQVWGFDFFGDSRTVDVHIKRLREKLPDSEQFGWSLGTVRGVGYKFSISH